MCSILENLCTYDSEDRISGSLAALKEKGFINYFGMQRFGTFSVSTHTIGKYVLTSDWERVCELILSPQEQVLPESVEARKVWADTKDAKKVLPLMPKKCVAEQAVLKMLSQNPKGFSNAVMQIPRNLRVMYAHAYQSYIWNMVASERIKQFGLEIREGDLVIEGGDSGREASLSPVGGDEEAIEDGTCSFVRARPVTVQEIASGAKSIYDVVLPTPGFDIVYPENELKNVYADLMNEDGIDYLNMRRNIKEFSLSGNYRHIVARPDSVEWWIKRCNSPSDQLVKTDLDLIGSDTIDRVSQEAGEGEKLAVVLKLRLGVSQYATMALREVMKGDTSRRGHLFDVRQG
jgi:tRNA pseudouridine13 synthase